MKTRKPTQKLVHSLNEQIEQLQVQLAGCSAAALEATREPAKRGQWGWSPAYQDVLDLRRKYDTLVGDSLLVEDSHVGETWTSLRTLRSFKIEKQDKKYVYYWLPIGSKPRMVGISIERLEAGTDYHKAD